MLDIRYLIVLFLLGESPKESSGIWLVDFSGITLKIPNWSGWLKNARNCSSRIRLPNMGISVPNVGRIILEGELVEPYVLRNFNGVALFELVDGQYRIENLEEQRDVKDRGE